jgi:hypothetical protein
MTRFAEISKEFHTQDLEASPQYVLFEKKSIDRTQEKV